MFLTQMHLNPARRGTRYLLGSPQRMHAAVMHAFPPGTAVDGSDGRVLWRVDREKTSAVLYVSSPTEPDLTHVVEQAGWPTAPQHWRTVSMADMHSRLTTDQEWVFRLTANPVLSRSREGQRSKRCGLAITRQEEWLRSRSESWGFDLLKGIVSERRQITFTRRGPERRDDVTLSIATFNGVLRVTDADLLRRSLAVGVGRAKGYGCGLITLAPPQ